MLKSNSTVTWSEVLQWQSIGAFSSRSFAGAHIAHAKTALEREKSGNFEITKR